MRAIQPPSQLVMVCSIAQDRIHASRRKASRDPWPEMSAISFPVIAGDFWEDTSFW